MDFDETLDPDSFGVGLDMDEPSASSSATAAAASVPADQHRNSMRELELALQEETKDITSRFEPERRPQPAGLDQALGSSFSQTASVRWPRQNANDFMGGTSATPALKYAAKGGGFTTGFDILSKEEQAKIANRAQRFGALVQEQQATASKDETMEESGMDVDEGQEWTRPQNLPETPPRTAMVRPEVVHVYGTDVMSTKDVLKYFEAYGPSHVEWIDDSSCNVVFKDLFSAKRALYFQLVDRNVNFGEDDVPGVDDIEPSRTALLGSMDDDDENNDSDGRRLAKTAAVLVPKSNNRLQRAKEYIPIQQQYQPIIKHNSGLFLRYATDYDRKERGAAAKSQYYAIHGRENPVGSGVGSGSSSMRYNQSSQVQHHYGRRSRADEDDVWERGRGIQTMSRLRRRMERGSQSPGSRSPSPGSRRRSWSRDRRLAGSRSSSAEDQGGRRLDREGSFSPGGAGGRSGGGGRREHGSRSPDSRDRLGRDDYETRGRRGDISSRLGERASAPDTAVENRMNDLAEDFMTELESSFSRREKSFPKTKTLYSDFLENEIASGARSQSQSSSRSRRNDSGRDRGDRDRDRRDRGRNGGGNSRRKDRNGRDEALKALDARLGVAVGEANVDEFGRAYRD